MKITGIFSRCKGWYCLESARIPILTIILIVLPVLLFFLSLFMGRYAVSPSNVLALLVSPFYPVPHSWQGFEETVFFQIRLPRVAAAMLVGGGLAIAGASFQGLFKNPLVSSNILGVTAGAGFGAALGILISGNSFVIQLFAFLFGIIAVYLAYALSRVYKSASTLVLVLAGIIVGAFFSALISLVKYIADPFEKLPAIVFWLMGSLASVTVTELVMVAPPILICMGILLLIRWRINLLAVGEEEARALGVDTKKMAWMIIICATIITASAVCISGIIGWIGLVIPHIGRMLVGPDYKRLLPVSVVPGACYLLIIDDIARTAISSEIPIGILTAIIGVPFFALLLSRRNLGWL